MKKTFPLQTTDHAGPRVIEAIKHDVRKYLKRERRKTPPDGFDFWEFDCRIGPDPTTAQSTEVKQVIDAIDSVAQAGGEHVYIEILARPAKWAAKPATAPASISAGENDGPV